MIKKCWWWSKPINDKI